MRSEKAARILILEMRLSEEELTAVCSKQGDGKSKDLKVGSEGTVNGRAMVREAIRD